MTPKSSLSDRTKTTSTTTTTKSATTTTSTTTATVGKNVESCPSFRSGHLPSTDDLKRLRTLSEPHVESFNYFLEYGLSRGIADIEPVGMSIVDPASITDETNPVDYDNLPAVEFWLENVTIAKPFRKNIESSKSISRPKLLLPRETRERSISYGGAITGTFCCRIVKYVAGEPSREKVLKLEHNFGNMPIMVMSTNCHLKGSTPKQLVKFREEQNEFGGYFIVNGIERCIRMLQIPRRNYATALQRNNFKKRGRTYTDMAVTMRCVRHNGDQSSTTNTLHYLTTGGCNLRFTARKQEFLVPVVLLIRCLSGKDSKVLHVTTKDEVPNTVNDIGSEMGITDEEIYRRIVQGDNKNTFLVARAALLLQDFRARFSNLNTPSECLEYIGARFRRITQKTEAISDREIGHYILRKYILIHLCRYGDKLECLLFMLRKLYSFAAGDCCIDNADSLQNQEILLPGHLLSAFVKEKFEEFLENLKRNLRINFQKNFKSAQTKLTDTSFWSREVNRASSGGIGKKVEYFLSTGNIISTTGLDLMQVSGYTIVAERLNFLRFVSHFRSVHRGQFFTEMKTTAVRKLLPDNWGFLCPVHTPDGGPCGLLSHLALKCKVMSYPGTHQSKGSDDLESLLISSGVLPCGTGGPEGSGRIVSIYSNIPVCLDGRVIGSASPQLCKSIMVHLRSLKVAEPPAVLPTLEIVLIPSDSPGTPYPGLYLFSEAARMIRPVIHRATGRMEFIGPLEQGFMNIACIDDDIREGITTHQELDPTSIFSLIASLTPFSDQNQSPRNMYQCQMSKQTMGTPCHSLPYRTDTKLYRLQTPQAPICQTTIHERYKMDEHPNGTNAVVAVISYTGYDMEDAMILSKSAFDRGFGHASILKTTVVDLEEEAKTISDTGKGDARILFGNKIGIDGQVEFPTLEADGFPKIGERVDFQDPICCTIDMLTKNGFTTKHKDREIAYVDSIRLISSDDNKPTSVKAKITMRYPRPPTIGDKFASRHGQKGVLSILWPTEDMPFSESGITPDIIINPHAFPSRMTIGMLVESMAGKSGALHGHFQDATPFSFHESGDKVSLDYFGEELQAAGYNYYGSEALYSGTTGCVMHADLYIGLVYYQRLRHMVSDKYQVRSTGAVNPLTRQPIKGRKRGGGIRLGEMERDSLLSHGCAFLLQDRLLNCSDRHVAYACSRCGDMLMPTTQRSLVRTMGQSTPEAASKPKLRLYCRSPSCQAAVNDSDVNDEAVEAIVLPYVYRYLVNELASMNIKISMSIR